VVRVVIIYHTSVSRAVSITEIPGVIAIGICLIASRQAGQRLKALVTERLRQPG
jgi:sensor domain CHASE-containing protein